MKFNFILIISILVIAPNAYGTQTSYAKTLSAYLPNESGNCRGNDHLTNEVCFPAASMFRGDFIEFHMYAVIELTEPERLAEYIISREKNRKLAKAIIARKPFEAYQAYIHKFEDGTLYLLDGTIGYVDTFLSVTEFQEAVLYRDGSEWHICVSNNTYQYEVFTHNPYTRSSISADSIEEIKRLDICS